MLVHALALVLAFTGAPTESSSVPSESESSLPAWNDKPARPSRPPKLPIDGGPSIVIGSLAIASGLGVIAGTIALHDDASRPELIAGGLVGGLLSVAGSGLLASGLVHRRHYHASTLGSATDRPPTGRGMRAGGVALTIGGTVSTFAGMLTITAASLDCQRCVLLATGATALGVGLVGITTGIALMKRGQARSRQFQSWRTQRRYEIQPSFGLGLRGVQVGLSGRF